MLKKRKTALLLGFSTVMITALTGCGGKDVAPLLISADTTFQEVFQADGIFRAVFVWPFVKVIDFFTGMIGPIGAIVAIAVIVNLFIFALSYRNSVRLFAAKIKFAPHKNAYSKNQQVTMYQDMQKVYTHFHASNWKMLVTGIIQFPIVIALYIAINSSTTIAESTILGIKLSTSMVSGLVLRNPMCYVIFIGMLLTQLFIMFAPAMFQKKPALSNVQMSNWFRLMTVFLFGLVLPIFVSIYYAVFNILSVLKSWIIRKKAYQLADSDAWDLPKVTHVDTATDTKGNETTKETASDKDNEQE